VSAVEVVGEERFRLSADRDVRPEAARVVVAHGGQLRRLSVEDPSLDAIYNRFFQDAPAAEARDAA
jgi:ABC-2 type transport system ATP-binding protein